MTANPDNAADRAIITTRLVAAPRVTTRAIFDSDDAYRIAVDQHGAPEGGMQTLARLAEYLGALT